MVKLTMSRKSRKVFNKQFKINKTIEDCIAFSYTSSEMLKHVQEKHNVSAEVAYKAINKYFKENFAKIN